jgi:PHD/YefM family antitoxin component YafN of YafNO toxin-antitoxin module
VTSSFGGIIMPAIRNSTDLINNLNEIREFCQNYREPIFLTNNGEGELAVMSIETYELMAGKLELYQLLDEGLEQEREGKLRSSKEVLDSIKLKMGF